MATNYKGQAGGALLIIDLAIVAKQAEMDGLNFVLTINIQQDAAEFQGEIFSQGLDGLTQRRLMFENMEYIAANEITEADEKSVKELNEWSKWAAENPNLYSENQPTEEKTT